MWKCALAASARVADGQSLSDTELVRLGCALGDARVRDMLWSPAVGECCAESLYAGWRGCCPNGGWRPWCCFAFSAYACGDGAAGRCFRCRLRCAVSRAIGWRGAGHGSLVCDLSTSVVTSRHRLPTGWNNRNTIAASTCVRSTRRVVRG